jgi:3',5'-cyclic AMP phosphodiesterase CpdA
MPTSWGRIAAPGIEPRSATPAVSTGGPTAPAATVRPFRVAHVSDPHLSRQYYREHLKSLKILLRTVLEEGADHIVISGDIVSTADPDDLYLAREVFSRAGVLDAQHLTVVPGNHDVFGGPHRAVDVLSFPSHIRSVDYHSHHAMFRDAFAETFEGAIRSSSGAPYPFVKHVGPLALVGLNSIPPWSLRRNILGTNGVIDDGQLAGLLDLAASGALEGRIPVVVVHHHFNDLTDDAPTNGLWRRIESRTMRLRKRRKLVRMFKEAGVQAVLHGHIHRNEIYQLSGVKFVNGAGSVCDDPVRRLKYNAVTVSEGRLTASVRALDIPYQESTVNRALVRRLRTSAQPALATQTQP